MRKVRLGVIGCGVIGLRHVGCAAKLPMAEVVAIAEPVEEKLKSVGDKFNIARRYASGAELLKDSNVEAVVLAVAAGDRVSLPLEALAQGKHVLIEKPVALSAAAVKKIQAAAGDRTVGCCSARFSGRPHIRAAAQLIASGALGEIRTVHGRAFNSAVPPTKTPPPWRLSKARNGGGILMNWGCYDLDYLLACTGWSLRPKQVMAQVWTVPPAYASYVAPGSDAETHVTAFIRCENGAVITLDRGEYMPAATSGVWQIMGSQGSLRLDLLPGDNKRIYFDRADTAKGVVSGVLWEGQEVWDESGFFILRDFCEAVLAGRQPSTGMAQALILQQISDAIYASAACGASVEIV